MKDSKLLAQKELELKQYKTNLKATIRTLIKPRIENTPYEVELNDLLPVVIIHKSILVDGLFSALYHQVKDGKYSYWNIAVALDYALSNRLLKITENGYLQSDLALSIVEQDMVDKYGVNNPMVIIPKKISNNHQIGYYFTKGSCVLKDDRTPEENRNMDLRLEHLNLVNSIQYKINKLCLEFPNNTHKVPSADKEEGVREVNWNTWLRFKKNQVALIQEYLDAYDGICYLIHFYDKRGRDYAKGYLINPQGTGFDKNILVLAHEEDLIPSIEPEGKRIKFGMTLLSPREALAVDMANNLGKDKLNWIDRIKYINSMSEEELYQATSQEDIDNPYLYMTACSYYIESKDNPSLTSGYPVSFDATASGSQILACLTGDLATAKICNVIGTGIREDSYTTLYKAFKKYVPEVDISRKDFKKAPMTVFYGSKKQPEEIIGEDNLPYFYKVMYKYCPLPMKLNDILLENWQEDVESYGWTLPDGFTVLIKNKTVVNEEIDLGEYGTVTISHKEISKLEKGEPGTRSYSANLVHSVDALILREVVAMAMHQKDVVARVTKLIENKSYQLFSNNKGKDIAMVEKLQSLYKQSGFLSDRILGYLHEGTISLLDEDTIEELKDMLDVINQMGEPFEVMTIHDCFRVLPKHVNAIRKAYIYQLYKIAKTKGKMLNFLLSQLFNTEVNFGFGKLNPEDVLNSDYALC